MRVVNRVIARTEALIDPRILPSTSSETLVLDWRANLSPSEEVQSKLMRLLPASAVPVSSLHTSRDTRRGARG